MFQMCEVLSRTECTKTKVSSCLRHFKDGLGYLWIYNCACMTASGLISDQDFHLVQRQFRDVFYLQYVRTLSDSPWFTTVAIVQLWLCFLTDLMLVDYRDVLYLH